MPQVPGYLETYIIHSFLIILNYKTVYACRSSIMDIPPVPNSPRTFKFPQRSFGLQIEIGYIRMRQTTSSSVMYAWLLTETGS